MSSDGGLKGRIINILFSFDCFAFTLLTLGKAYPFESFSSAAYRAEQHGMFYGKARPIIDWFFCFEPSHCKRAFERASLNLPPDQRGASQ